MKKTQIFRMAIDCMMLILLPLLMLYSLLGEAIHEWLGLLMTALFISHHVLNRAWFRSPRKGRYGRLRILVTVTDLLLLLDMLELFLSGIMISRHVFVFLNIGSWLAPGRIVHLLASYWGMLLMSFHTGLHGGLILGMFRKMARISNKSKTRTLILRVIALFLSACGILAFFRRQIWTYLTLQNQFVFFDFSEPMAAIVFDYLSSISLFAIIAYYLSKALR